MKPKATDYLESAILSLTECLERIRRLEDAGLDPQSDEVLKFLASGSDHFCARVRDYSIQATFADLPAGLGPHEAQPPGAVGIEASALLDPRSRPWPGCCSDTSAVDPYGRL